MKVSFLVTYYNQEQFVRQSLDSILAIDLPSEWEILIGDDGSSDGTTRIAQEYVKQYPGQVMLYTMPREEGVTYDPVKRASANRLNLLSKCTGDCFCTLDGDDFYFDQTFVKEAIEVFETCPDISLVLFGLRFFRDGKLAETHLLPDSSPRRMDKRDYLRNDLYLHAGAGVHRILWDKDRLTYIREIGYFDDTDIVVNSLNYGEMYYIHRAVYAYRQTGESLYTSMKEAEQAVLNVQGYDVDKKLIDPAYDECLVIRNSVPFLTMYFNRKNMKTLLGTEKYERYLRLCSEIEDSIAYKLLQYPSSGPKGEEEIKRIIKMIKSNDPMLYRRQKAKQLLKGFSKGLH